MTTAGQDVHEMAEQSDAYYHVLPQTSMPGHVKLTVKAGDVACAQSTTHAHAHTYTPPLPYIFSALSTLSAHYLPSCFAINFLQIVRHDDLAHSLSQLERP